MESTYIIVSLFLFLNILTGEISCFSSTLVECFFALSWYLIFPTFKIFKNKNKETIIEVDSIAKNKFKKSDWDYLETIFIIFENAYRKCRGDASKLRELFYAEIENWKAKN